MLFIMRGTFNKNGRNEFFYVSERHSIIIHRRSDLIAECYKKKHVVIM